MKIECFWSSLWQPFRWWVSLCIITRFIMQFVNYSCFLISKTSSNGIRVFNLLQWLDKIVGQVSRVNKCTQRVIETYWTGSCGSKIHILLNLPPRRRIRSIVNYFESRVENLPFKAIIEHTLDSGAVVRTNVVGVYSGASNIRFYIDQRILASWNESRNCWIKKDN